MIDRLKDEEHPPHATLPFPPFNRLGFGHQRSLVPTPFSTPPPNLRRRCRFETEKKLYSFLLPYSFLLSEPGSPLHLFPSYEKERNIDYLYNQRQNANAQFVVSCAVWFIQRNPASYLDLPSPIPSSLIAYPDPDAAPAPQPRMVPIPSSSLAQTIHL